MDRIDCQIAKWQANKPMQPTPLRVPKIVAFLKAGSGSNAFPIYWWRRS